MTEDPLFNAPLFGTQSLQTSLNAQLAPAGIAITPEEACELAEHRSQCLHEVERIEFETPAVVSIARELANSNILQCADAASVLTALQALFYQTRDELPIEVPDEEIIEALTNCYMDQGDAIDVAKIPTGELMAHSRAYRKAQEETEQSSYSITDDTGRAYAFDPAEWDYDETAAGWDGERWDSCWNE